MCCTLSSVTWIEGSRVEAVARRTPNAFTGIFLHSLSMVVDNIPLHLALIVLKDAILLQTGKCCSSLRLWQFHRMLHDFLIFVLQYNVPVQI